MNNAARVRWLRHEGYTDQDGDLTAKGEAYAEERHLGTWAYDEQAFEGAGPVAGRARAPVGTGAAPGPGVSQRQDEAEEVGDE